MAPSLEPTRVASAPLAGSATAIASVRASFAGRHTPARQASPASHAASHTPQCIALVARSTQSSPQVTRPGSQADSHEPATHVSSGVSQALLQAPQLALSVCVLTQLVPHPDRPEGHSHAPSRQDCPTGQVAPQDPQLTGSVSVFTQTSLHDSVSLGHAQVPPTQAWPGVHAMLHAPQWADVVIVSTQIVAVPPSSSTTSQDDCPDSHWLSQAPAMHISPASQTVPQLPQLALSV